MNTGRESQIQTEFWSKRYNDKKTGWDIGYPSTPLKEYIDQLENKDIEILIPGAGNAYEAEYLWKAGFTKTHVLDISPVPLASLKSRIPEFPDDQLIEGNFFDHEGAYDLIIEQTFFCSFLPSEENRTLYADQMTSLLRSEGKLVGLWFDIPLIPNSDKRPFGGSRDSYLSYLQPHFDVLSFEPCYNSIDERHGSELFGIFKKKK